MRPWFFVVLVRMDAVLLREQLDSLYARLNRRAYVSPDPLEVVYRYEDPRDREVAGLIAAGLAYGRVAQILRNLHGLLDALGPSLAARIRTEGAAALSSLPGFRHRWTDAAEMGGFLDGIAQALHRHGSLEACFLSHCAAGSTHTLSALEGFTRELRGGAPPNSLLSAPEKGSACKRLHLYLRWMVRRDDVDPGCWTGVSPQALLIPLDTHMHRLARGLGLTRRNQANFTTTLEVTNAFRRINPDDPLKYDFALTRLGIRGELDPVDFLHACGVPKGRVQRLLAPASAKRRATRRPARSRLQKSSLP